jgi:plasmid stabilization system protein ParE
MEIRLLESAKDDLREGWRFYEQQAAGVGDYFLDSIQVDVQSLRLYAGIHERAEGFHRMLAKRFPFAIYYLIDEDRLDIYAILDCRRDPNSISKRLGSVRSE